MSPPRLLRRTSPVCLAGALLLVAAARAAEPAAPDNLEPAAFVEAGGVRYHEVNFYRLSAFRYPIVDASTGASEAEIAEDRKHDKIPAWVRAYDGKPVALRGYMLPITLVEGLATKFILMRDTNTCCYGNVPNINEFVIVTMQGKGVRFSADIPVTLAGTFRIIERYEEGFLLPIFEMTGDRMID